MASITGCDCAESLAIALGGIILPARVSWRALPMSCPWCGARSAEARPEAVTALADLALRN